MLKSIGSFFGILPHFSFMMNSRKCAAFVFSLFLLCINSAAEQKTVTLGGKSGWTNYSIKSGISDGTGKFGFPAIQLAGKKTDLTDETLMYLSFENGTLAEKTGRYEIIENHLISSSQNARNKFSGLSRGIEKGIVLKEKKSSYASSSTLGGSFMIEFWISPSLAENGEKLFDWRTSRNKEDYSEFQRVSAVFVNNRLEWTFKNIFPDFPFEQITVKGFNAVIPGEWSRHTILFNEENGCLEYCVNGMTEDIAYITDTGHEGGMVCLPVIGGSTTVEICPFYTGKIDDIVTVRSLPKNSGKKLFMSGNEPYDLKGGRYVSAPVLTSPGSELNCLNAITSVPAETSVKFFVRSGENQFEWTYDYPEWKEVLPGEKIEGVKGLYFQVAAELLPDGQGIKSPSVTQIDLTYTVLPPPLPPFYVAAEEGDEQVTLTWSHSVDDNIAGYYIYYGNRPGEYLGSIALEGDSPVRTENTTSFTLTGLENGRIYYFAVSAIAKGDYEITGELSKEVFARPSKRLKGTFLGLNN